MSKFSYIYILISIFIFNQSGLSKSTYNDYAEAKKRKFNDKYNFSTGLTNHEKSIRCGGMKEGLKKVQNMIYDLKLNSDSTRTLFDYQKARDKVMAELLMLKGLENFGNFILPENCIQ